MNVLKRAADSIKWLIVLVAVYSGVTQPLFLAVPKSQQQIEQCFANNKARLWSQSPTPCGKEMACGAVRCAARKVAVLAAPSMRTPGALASSTVMIL